MANLDKDIAETRDTLVKHINSLTLNYSQLLHEKTNIESNKNTEILLLIIRIVYNYKKFKHLMMKLVY